MVCMGGCDAIQRGGAGSFSLVVNQSIVLVNIIDRLIDIGTQSDYSVEGTVGANHFDGIHRSV